MKSINYILIIFIVLFMSSALEVTAQSNLTNPERINYNPNHPAVPGEILVKFRPETFGGTPTQINGTIQTSQASVNEIFIQLQVSDMAQVFRAAQTPLGDIYRLRFESPLLLPDALGKMAADPNVEWVEPNYLSFTSATPNDPSFSSQWGLVKIQAEQAWDISQGDSGIIIAIIDTGVDYDHLDLEDNIWHNPGEPLPHNSVDDDGNGYVDDDIGWDFVSVTTGGYPGEDMWPRDRDPMDFDGHGTHCSGIASAVTNNGIGIAGTAWNCKIMALRAGYKNADGGGSLAYADSAEALYYAADNGAHVVSMSWGGPDSGTLQAGINYAYDAGCVLVAAAGNDGVSSPPHYPAAYPNVIGVAASDRNDNRAYFSNYGSWVDIAAPGVSIYSTYYDNTYTSLNGTSMSTPIVSGAAALLLSNGSALTHDAIGQRFINSADDVGWALRLNVYNALNLSIPDSPTNLAATSVSSTQVDLTWDDVSGENGYHIQRKITGEEFQQIGVTVSNITNYSDTALEPETSYTYRVRAYNANGNSDWSGDATAVTPPNNPPEVDITSDVSFDEDESNTIDLDDYVTDPDHTPAEMTWGYSGNANVSVDIDSYTHVATFTAPENWNGSDTVTFTATDPGGLSDSDTVAVTVNAVNDAPVVNITADVSFDEDGTHSGVDLDDYVTDPDNAVDGMTWTYSGNTNIIVSIDSSDSFSHVVTFSAPDDWNGSENITFTATDPGASSGSDTLTVTVNPVNDAPVVDPISDVSFDEDGSHSEIDLDDYVSDLDNTDDDMTWTYTDVANIIVYVDVVPERRVTFTPFPDWNGAETITFTATDPGGLSDSKSMTVTVNAVNDPPVVNFTSDVNYDEGGSNNIDLDDHVTDPDNTPAEMTWAYSDNASVSVSINSTSHIATFTTPADWNGSETITFVATDPDASSGSDTLTVTVNPVNDPPVVNITSDVSFDEDGSDTIDLDDYVTDPDNTPAEMTWTYTGNTSVSVSINSSTHIATFSAPANWNGSDTVTFTATDPGGLSDSDTVTVTVNPVNDPPVLEPIPDVSFDEDGSHSEMDLDNYVSDIDNTDDDMIWTYSGNTDVNVSVNSSASHVVTFTASVDWNGSETITFTATDTGGLGDSRSMTVNVNAVNDAPTVTNLAINPFPPELEDDMNALYTYSDVDGGTEISVEIKWYKNGGQQPYDGILTIPSSATSIGEEWYFTARPGDGIDFGDTRSSPSVVIDGVVQELHLYPGRNLFSIYADTANTDLLSVLAPIEGLYTSVSTYDPILGGWKQYTPGGFYAFNNLDNIEYGKGYYINMIEEAVFTIVGERITDTSIFLRHGWNLAGYSSSGIQPLTDALLSIDGLYIYVWTHDSSTGEWLSYIINGPNGLIRMEQGRAYWIYVGQDCTWSLPP